MTNLLDFLDTNGISYNIMKQNFVSFTYNSLTYRFDFSSKKLYMFFYGNRLELEFTEIETEINECNNYMIVYFEEENNLYVSFKGGSK